MRARLRTLRHDEQGMSFVFVGLGFMAFLSATTLAIDIGMYMTARSQAQNSADAGALAGAVALVFNDYNDRSASGPAVQNALSAAHANQVMAGTVSATPPDVTFPNDPQGLPNRVRINVFRTTERGNAVPSLIASLFGIMEADVSATATAEASPANAATCVKPWAVPDKWDERQTPPWSEDDTFDLYFPNGNPLPNPDVYHPVDHPNYTGYSSHRDGPDYGRQILLKPGNPKQAISPSIFFPIAMPPNTGANWYESNIPGCWPGLMEIGDMIAVEPGNMTGPTKSGTEALIAKDPGGYWDAANRRVVSSQSPSARIIIIPVFDPYVFETGRKSGRIEIKVANLVAFFVEQMDGNNVRGRIVPATGLIRGNGPQPSGAFLKAIRLVE